jgi:hypothetical protein
VAVEGVAWLWRRGILREEIALSLDKSLTTPDWVGLGYNEPKKGGGCDEEKGEAAVEGEDKTRRNFKK